MSYQAVVCRVKTYPHPNADRIQLARVANGNQVVVSLDVEDNELGIFFPSDGILSNEFLIANNLYTRLDETGKNLGGFFKLDRRVRAQSFRGEKSDGYWTRLSSLESLNDYLYGLGVKTDFKEGITFKTFVTFQEALNALKEGDTLDEIAGIIICKKFFNKKTLHAIANREKKSRSEHFQFPKHVDTAQFRNELDKIPEGSILHISEKLHGTSGRYGCVLREAPLPKGFKGIALKVLFWFLKAFKFNCNFQEWGSIVGTRNVIIENTSSLSSFYGNEAFRFKVEELLKDKLQPGEVVYGEIVGWVSEDKPIMARHKATDVGKDFVKIYGPTVTYAYNEPNGLSSFYPYRITKVDNNGNVVELSEAQMRARSTELGLSNPPSFCGPLVYTKDLDLESLVNSFVEGGSLLDAVHPREGVVIRVDTPNGKTYFLKEKAHYFKVMEGFAKSNDEEVDLEEAS